jgi:hypothetical protein
MRVFVLSLSALICGAALMVAVPNPVSAEPKVLPVAQGQTASKMEEVGYRYRRYRYGYRPYYHRRYGYYRPYRYGYYRPYRYGYYRPYRYGYYRPYYRPYYYGYGYPYYRPYWRPGFSIWF